LKELSNIMRVAIVHYWLVGMRGGEQVLEALLDLYPQADIFTHVYAPHAVSPKIRQQKVYTTFINKLPLAIRHYQSYLPLMPLALESLDLSDYDLVISSESGPAKGVIVPPAAMHVCYCHTPMRYIWDFYHRYRRQAGFFTRTLMPPLCHYLRLWDVSTAARVDAFASNSVNVSRRIARFYGRRDTVVIPPPITVANFDPTHKRGERYLYVGELVAYKQPETAVEACLAMDRPLTVIGGGPLLEHLSAMAKGRDIEVLGRQEDAVVREHLSHCRALLFPGEEDFGLVPVEAMASGAPVIASARGGALETVVDGETGMLYPGETAQDLMRAMERFERAAPMDSARLAAWVAQFDVAVFRNNFERFISASENTRMFANKPSCHS
jgi:glycosyltransferase involved in cell wall biosynthesis